MLLAFTLPPTVPFWIPIVGSVVAIVVGKHVFGGLGNNIFNPALVGRAFLLAAWPVYMTTWASPVSRWAEPGSKVADAVTTATPLAAMKLQGQTTPLIDLFIGNTGGCLGATSVLAIFIGASYLLYKRTVTWHIPSSFIGTVFVFSFLLGQDPVFHLFAGGLMLGAFYMATDVVTSPVTKSGRLVFGCGAGIITVIIRQFGGYPEGVCYAILIMNALTPLIEKYTTRKYKPNQVAIPLMDKIMKNR
jgi:electron transport complex protein RnfD